ncbi:MAG: hypothetical protein LBE78_10530 [Burkholderiaceae bacterium]|nr:hypothetical protein [Burkholderiaceae bacterium]
MRELNSTEIKSVSGALGVWTISDVDFSVPNSVVQLALTRSSVLMAAGGSVGVLMGAVNSKLMDGELNALDFLFDNLNLFNNKPAVPTPAPTPATPAAT